MAKKKITIEQLDASLARWQTRLKRAVNAIDRLQKQRKRAVRAEAQPIKPAPRAQAPQPLAVKLLREMAAEGAAESAGSVAMTPPPPAAPVDDGIPAFLKRTKLDPVAEAIKAEQAETKRLKAKGRIAKMLAKKSGETRKMPLTGKAALAAIRG